MKLENNKIYIGVFNYNYIGRYNEELNCLENCQLIIPNKETTLSVTFPNHPALLKKKFINELVSININVDKFLYLIDIDEIESGPDFEKIYFSAINGVDLVNG